ncbi:hypothetical protein G6F68_021219 [Rhizopus microsporus]|nr:hypothetical protein G6F68_021219 [Rhizopus microsporus]
MFARATARFAARPATASLRARTFATASRATAAGVSRRGLAVATAVTAGALSYAYLQSNFFFPLMTLSYTNLSFF